MLLKVTITRSETPGPAFELDRTFGQEGGTIGRGSENSFVIPDPKMEVSRQHATIECRDGAYVVTDTSRNGLSVNGQILGNGNSTQLHEGDYLAAGGFEMAVSLVPDPGETAEVLGPVGPEPVPVYPGVLAENAEQTMDAGPEIPSSSDDVADVANLDAASAALSAAAPENGLLGENRQRDVLEVLERADRFAVPVERQPYLATDSLDRQAHGTPASRESPPRTDQAESNEPPAARPDALEQTGDDAPPLTPAPALPPNWKDPKDTTGDESYAELAQAPEQSEPAAPAPEPVVGAPCAPPAAVEDIAAQSDDSRLVAALKEGINVPDFDVDPEEAAIIVEIVGRVVRESVEGVRRVLIARNEIKDTFRLPVTRLQKVENNPLKFSVSVEDALMKLLQPKPKGYLPPVESVREVFRDLEIHEIAVITGMRAALERILSRFEPDELERRLESHFLDNLVPATRKAKLWELFTEHYEEIHREAKDAFDQLYGGEFADAYEAEIRTLKLRLEMEETKS